LVVVKAIKKKTIRADAKTERVNLFFFIGK